MVVHGQAIDIILIIGCSQSDGQQPFRGAERAVLHQPDGRSIATQESISKEEVGGMLKCKLCGGLLRFAHTLVECGHTFCQQCIFEHIHSFKGKRPEVKCPECHGPIDPPFSKSVMKDIFKQSLVDTVEPSYKETEKILIDRISKLFPNYKLDFLLE